MNNKIPPLKITLPIGIFVFNAILFVLLSYYLRSKIFTDFLEDFINNTEREVSLVSNIIDGALREKNFAAVKDVLVYTGTYSDVKQVLLINDNQEVLFSNKFKQAKKNLMEVLSVDIPRSILENLPINKTYQTENYILVIEEVAVGISPKTLLPDLKGYLLVLRELTGLKNKISLIQRESFYLIILFYLLLSLSLWFFIHLVFSKRLNTIIEGIDSSNITALEGNDELARLSQEFENAWNKLNANEKQYRSLVEANSDPILVDYQGKIIFGNKKLFDFLEASDESEVLMQPSVRFLEEPKYLEVANSGMLPFEVNLTTLKGNKILVEVTAVQFEFRNKIAYHVIVRDMREQKRLIESLVEAKQRAEHADQLKSEFLAQMSHEIRTPVNTILNFLSLIKNYYENADDEEITLSFQMIENGSNRLIRTIDSILNMAQFQIGGFELYNENLDLTDELLINLVKEFQPQAANKGLEMHFENKCGSFITYLDRYSMSQLFVNLIENAIKYTDNGEIRIITEKTHDNSILVRVKDTGIGISKEAQQNIFEPFSQEERGYTRKFEGAGLGLALVMKYAEANDLKIELVSEKNIGTEFIIYIKKKYPSGKPNRIS